MPQQQTRKVPKISKRDLSPTFLEYYWPLEVKYHIRQGIDPDKDPVVMKLIRQLAYADMVAQGENLAAFKDRMPGKYSALVAEVERAAFDDVIPRFHIVHGVPITPEIFKFTGRPGKLAILLN